MGDSTDSQLSLLIWANHCDQVDAYTTTRFNRHLSCLDFCLVILAWLSAQHIHKPSAADAAKSILSKRIFTDLHVCRRLASSGHWTQLLAILRHAFEGVSHLELFNAHPQEGEAWLTGKRFEMREIQGLLADRKGDGWALFYKFLARRAHPNAEAFFSRLFDEEEQPFRPSKEAPGWMTVTTMGFPSDKYLEFGIEITQMITIMALFAGSDRLRSRISETQWERRLLSCVVDVIGQLEEEPQWLRSKQ